MRGRPVKSVEPGLIRGVFGAARPQQSGDAVSARALSQRALSRFRECDEAPGVALVLAGLAEIAHEEGATHEAVAMAAEALTVLRGAVDARPLANVAEVAVIVDGALSPALGMRRSPVVSAASVCSERSMRCEPCLECAARRSSTSIMTA